MKSVIVSNGGFIFKTVGDVFCASFNYSKNAVETAIEIPKRIIKEFQDRIEIKVRMGIHTDQAEVSNGDSVRWNNTFLNV